MIGTGDVAVEGKLVTVAYKGMLLSNGEQFNESRGISFFRLSNGKVIAGWEQDIIDMKVGGKRILKIPPHLAYGDRKGAGGAIPPGSHRTFNLTVN